MAGDPPLENPRPQRGKHDLDSFVKSRSDIRTSSEETPQPVSTVILSIIQVPEKMNVVALRLLVEQNHKLTCTEY